MLTSEGSVKVVGAAKGRMVILNVKRQCQKDENLEKWDWGFIVNIFGC